MYSLTNQCVGPDVQYHQAGVELEHFNEEFSAVCSHSTRLKI